MVQYKLISSGADLSKVEKELNTAAEEGWRVTHFGAAGDTHATQGLYSIGLDGRRFVWTLERTVYEKPAPTRVPGS
jgi:hypothetical protein